MTYSAANRLATYNGLAVQFDADGNLVSDPLSGEMANFSFDSRNRLIQASETSYRYDAENQRLGVNQTNYVINSQPALSQVLVKEENGVKTFYVYGLGLLGEEKEGEYRAYHFDFRGSTVALTDKAGKVVQRFQYGPYGELLKGDASVTPFLFNGKYGVMTDDNGLYYMRARFYSAEMKRFVNQDVLLGNIASGQTLNRYAFVTGQPVNFIDPFGLDKYCGQCAPGAYDCLIYHDNLCNLPSNSEQFCGQCAPGSYDCLIYNYNRCESPLEKAYNYARTLRVWGHQTYPGEQNSNMRHCVVSCIVASREGVVWGRSLGVGNELQGFILHDVFHLWGRVTGQSLWAFQLQDLLSNENGFSCAKINQCLVDGSDSDRCSTCCTRYLEK